MKWFKFYGQDWLTDIKIIRMSTDDRLRFITLLCLASSTEKGDIKDCDDEMLNRLSHINSKAGGAIKRFVDLGILLVEPDGTIIIKNFEERQSSNLTGYERVKRYRDKQKEENQTDNVDGVIIDNARTEENRTEQTRTEKKTSMLEKEELFNYFWSEYPNKADKKKAHDKFLKLDVETMKLVIADVQKRKATHDTWLKDEGKYIPMPTTYINNERWNDAIIPLKGKPSNIIKPSSPTKYDKFNNK